MGRASGGGHGSVNTSFLGHEYNTDVVEIRTSRPMSDREARAPCTRCWRAPPVSQSSATSSTGPSSPIASAPSAFMIFDTVPAAPATHSASAGRSSTWLGLPLSASNAASAGRRRRATSACARSRTSRGTRSWFVALRPACSETCWACRVGDAEGTLDSTQVALGPDQPRQTCSAGRVAPLRAVADHPRKARWRPRRSAGLVRRRRATPHDGGHRPLSCPGHARRAGDRRDPRRVPRTASSRD